MTAFELDMAFEPEEVATGLEQLFEKLGLAAVCERRSAPAYAFTITLADGGQAQVVVRPLPVERLRYLALFPRTLLEARATDGADLAELRRSIVLAFLRVSG